MNNKTPEEILAELQNIFCSVLDNDTIVLSMETTMDDIEEWDSIAHIELISEITKVFNVQFTTGEMSLWENVGDIALSVAVKIANS